ncbi:MAG: ABC transporter ATP-binding protein [SAR202 cluster bacterium]|nr:ABC transporter ATP-binding protein [SAR202 cluster bacterium]|tara:strand:+ start:18535 stop:19839 length:1305 start_codon:yes stop_codon:yes gene_type:complete
MKSITLESPSSPQVGSNNFELLRVKDLTVSITGTKIIDSISFSLTRGETLGVVGANGSGKTTLIRSIAGLLKPDVGTIRVQGVDGSDLGHRDRARIISYMPQQVQSHPFTAFEAVLMGRYPHLGRLQLEGVEDREIAFSAMRRTGTESFADRRLDTLSGGERQRVVMARVLAQQPQILLMDEPTASLDLEFQILAMDLINDEVAKRNSGAIVILHDLSLAARFCDRILLMQNGELTAKGTPWEVLTPENLRAAFNIEGLVEPDPVTGMPHVLVLGSEKSGSKKSVGFGRTVHMVCGAGSGRQLMHQLKVAGYAVTAGVLGTGDSDREAAERLGVKYVSAPSFSPISESQHSEHIELINRADHVVLCPMAVGMNNLLNIHAAAEGSSLFVIESPDGKVSDYTGGKALELRRSMVERAGSISEASLLFELARHALE